MIFRLPGPCDGVHGLCAIDPLDSRMSGSVRKDFFFEFTLTRRNPNLYI